MALEDGLGSAAQGASAGAAFGPMGAAIGGGLGLLGGILGGNSARKAAAAKAAALKAAGEAAAKEVRFRPVGTTSAFGTTNYQYDPTTGQLVSGGYELSPELASIQGGLLGQAGGTGLQTVTQAQQAQQGLFGLGQQFLPTSTQYTTDPNATAYATQLQGLSQQVLPQNYDTTEAAQKYMQQQQALLAPGREQAWANLNQSNYNRGTTGLQVAQGGNLQAANPYASALANTQAMQDLQLAANAQQQARSNLAQDINLGTQLGGTALNTAQSADTLAYQRMLNNINTGAGLFGTGLNIATSGYNPLKSALGGALSVEQMGQIPFQTAMDLSGRQQAANQQAANYMFQGAGGAATAMQPANAYNPMATALTGLSQNKGLMNTVGNWFTPTPQVDTSTVGYTGPDRGLWF